VTGASIFGSQPPAQSGGFGSSLFGGGGGGADVDDSCYTKVDELSAEDMQEFKAEAFSLDKIPLVPPPRELCF
jgi:hypothetical protein